MLPAVDRQRRAGDEIGLVGGQEHHAAGDVVGMAEPAHRDAGDDLLQHVLGHRAHHLGIDIARRHRVHRDAEPRALLRQRLGEAVDARLGGGVVHLPVLPGLPVQRADIDDAPELGRAHVVEHQLAQVEAGAEVGVDHRIPHVARHPRHGGVAGDTGVVDQHFDLADLGVDAVDRFLAGVEVAHVELVDGDAGRLVEGVGRRVVAGVIGHHGAAGRLQTGG